MSMHRRPIAAILLLGGTGSRFGGDKPKQFQLLSGKKIYLHTLEKFIGTGVFNEVLLVVPSDHLSEVQKDIQSYSNVTLKVIPGGKTRQESSYQGLIQCSTGTEYVVIHDAVRPFVSKDIVLKNLEQVRIHGAIDTCVPSFDTIVESFDGGAINRIPKRDHYLRGQTPQSFQYDIILRAHQHAIERGLVDASDDCRLVLDDGRNVHIVLGDEHNIKITTELDLFLAEQIMRLQRYALPGGMDASLKGKQYVVIGATGGIGKAITELLQMHGAMAIPLSRTSTPYSMDVAHQDSVEKAFSDIAKDYGPVDGLINSAGLLKIQELKELSFNEIQEMLNVNLHGVIYSCKCCKIRPGGHIVNIASSSFTRGRKHYSVYSCAKAAVVNFTQALSEELPGLNINAVIPQRTLTPMRQVNFPGEDAKSLLDPMDVAKTIIELLQQQATGQIVEIRKKGEDAKCH